MVDSSQPPASRRVVGPAQSGDAEADSVKDGGGGGGDGGGGDKTPDPQVPTESTGTTTSKLATTIISSSSSASSDDSPLPSPTLGDSEPARTLRKDKSRVRFNSDACWPGDPQLDPREARRGSEPNLPLRQPKHGSSRPRPRPLGVLRSHSSNLLPSSSSAQEPHRGVELERAVSAAAANWRAGNFSGSVQWGDNSAREPSDQHAPERTDARDGEGPRECEPEGSIQLHETVINGGNQSAEGHENPEHVNHELYRHLVEQQAQHLVWCHTRRFHDATGHVDARGRGQAETTTPTQAEEGHAGPTEVDEGPDDMNDVPPPSQYRASVLSQLLRLYKPTPDAVMTSHTRNWSASTLANTSSSSADDGGERRPNPSLSGGTWSGSTTPPRRKWYNGNRSHDTLANLVEASKRLAHPNPASSPEGGKPTGRPGARRDSEGGRRSSSATTLQQRDDEEASVTVQIADTLVRQEYIVSLCRALMLYGAPSHRLEEYLSMKARFLKIDGQFLYLPGSMVISFDDRSTHTTEVRMVRSAQGIDLGRLKDVHRIYKEVIHNVMDVEEGRERLDKLMNSRDRVHPWLRVVAFGLTSAACATFSFRARLIDLPLCFCLGCLVGFLQIIVAPRSKMYNNVFEVSAVILVSFLSRAFGSIAGGSLFCFSAMAQSSIVILLPGYLVLCSALEIQSRAIVPGSIRIVYATVYSLLLGFGITIGAALYGIVDENATSATTCTDPLSPYIGFAFVPAFVVSISMFYQAQLCQVPAMIVVAFAGHVVNFYSSRKLSASPQIANTLSALCVGLLANIDSRLRHSVAAATLIPSIFTQVPGGLASTGGLLSGLSTADLLTRENNTAPDAAATDALMREQQNTINAVVFNVAASMVQIAIGIAVGLFLSALIVYPTGKRRSGLFSF